MSIEWKDCKYHDDIQEILDMATGVDGGLTFHQLRMFLIICEEQGTEVPSVTQFAKLCRGMSNPNVFIGDGNERPDE